MESIKYVIDIVKPLIDIVLIPIIAGIAWVVKKYYSLDGRITDVERVVMKDGKISVVKADELKTEVDKVTVTFSTQHDLIKEEFRAKIDNIEDDIKEIKEYMKADQKHKIDLSGTLSGISENIKHMNTRRRVDE